MTTSTIILVLALAVLIGVVFAACGAMVGAVTKITTGRGPERPGRLVLFGLAEMARAFSGRSTPAN